MTKRFQHIPVKTLDIEAGIPTFEHCLNLVGENNGFWQYIDHLFNTETKLSDKEALAVFKSSLLEYLANFIYENPPHVADNNARQIKIEALESVSNAVEKILKNYKHIKTDMFLFFSEESREIMEETQQQSDDLLWYAHRKEREFLKSLKVLQKIAHNSSVPSRKDPATVNAHLQECMAIYLAESLSNIGIKPTTTREGFFEELFKACCKVVGFKEPKPGNRHIEAAVRHIGKNPKRS